MKFILCLIFFTAFNIFADEIDLDRAKKNYAEGLAAGDRSLMAPYENFVREGNINVLWVTPLSEMIKNRLWRDSLDKDPAKLKSAIANTAASLDRIAPGGRERDSLNEVLAYQNRSFPNGSALILLQLTDQGSKKGLDEELEKASENCDINGILAARIRAVKNGQDLVPNEKSRRNLTNENRSFLDQKAGDEKKALDKKQKIVTDYGPYEEPDSQIKRCELALKLLNLPTDEFRKTVETEAPTEKIKDILTQQPGYADKGFYNKVTPKDFEGLYFKPLRTITPRQAPVKATTIPSDAMS